MSLLIDLAGGVIKTVSAARTTSRATGLDTPALEELHDGLSPVRTEFQHARPTGMETYDDIFEREGKRDEVQISVITIVLDKDGKLIGMPSEKTTPIMGDTYRLANRVKAGRASDRGGLMTGDSFPDEPMQWLPATPTSPERDYPPYVIWEGECRRDEKTS